MNRFSVRAAGALVVVTLVIWLSRIGLAWGDDSLSLAGKVLATLPVAVFVGLAVAAGLLLVRSRASPRLAHAGRVATQALAAWTIGYWALRLPWILARSHPAAFKIVHTVLALISVGIAVLVLNSIVRPVAPPSGSRRVRA